MQAGAIDRLLAAIVLLAVCCFVGPVRAVDTFVVEDIRVEGLDRISPGTVFNYLPVKVGDSFDESRSGDAVRALFKTGFFKDISLAHEGNVLVVKVVEREAIGEINITGNKAIKSEELLKGLKDIGLSVGEVYEESTLDKVVQELRRQYYSQGKYGVRLEPDVKPLEGNRVAVNINISEGKAARIKAINIVGNKAYDDGELIDQFKLTTRNWLSFFTRSDQYSRQKLSGDLESLRSYYLDNGYINFNVDSTQVSITPDKTEVYITVNITEGERFTVSEVKLAGELIVPQEDLFEAVTTRKGMIFSRKSVTESSKAVTDRLGEDGYAFANVNAIPDIDEAAKTVAITYFVDPGNRTYVRRITFAGNAKTRDEVLRREMRQMEGSWISTTKVERSKVRLQRLGYFSEVNVETVPVPGTTDQVDVNFTVVERPSGNLLLGLGFSQSQGIIFNTSVAQDNFLGSGKRIEFAFNNSDINRQFVFGYTNPYYTLDGISRGFRVAYQETNASDANITRFDSKIISVGVNYGIPVTEYNFVNVAFDYERTELNADQFFVATIVRDFLNREGNEFDVLRLTAGFAYDTRNDAIFPTEGVLHRVRSEMAVPPGDLNYYKVDYDARWFVPLTRKWTFLLKGRVGWGDSYGKTDELPFFENLFAGGPRTVRGYKENTLGPEDEFGRAIGGNLLVVGNAEIILPLPFLAELKSVRVTGFIDAGNVYGTHEDFEADKIRMSTGISGVWMSPFGVLTASIAKPFRDQNGDETQPFQFTFGTSF
ncbi:MAG: outer membrane protein assembly factor BamA [Gammaproteobacteria bacterium]|nr:outer membrane protein assembly factor BamA [Gammaproteobacteria bacterium]